MGNISLSVIHDRGLVPSISHTILHMKTLKTSISGLNFVAYLRNWNLLLIICQRLLLVMSSKKIGMMFFSNSEFYHS